MSQANVEIVKPSIDAYNRRDVEALANLVTPDFELLPAMPGAVEGEGYRGREGVETYLGEISDTWEEYRNVGDDFRDLDDRVLMLGRIEVRGKRRGVPVDAPLGVIFDFRGGKMSRTQGYVDHREALRAAGLSE